jgi:hypothetical protein
MDRFVPKRLPQKQNSPRRFRAAGLIVDGRQT